jgi:hypothetical protein
LGLRLVSQFGDVFASVFLRHVSLLH